MTDICNKCELGECLGDKMLTCSLFYEYLGYNPDRAGELANEMDKWFKSGKSYIEWIDSNA